MFPSYCRKFFKPFPALVALFAFNISFAQTEIGLELYSFRNQLPKDIPGMLQKISSMGIRNWKVEEHMACQ